MAELADNSGDNSWCKLLEEVYTYCQPTQETFLILLAVLKWLTRPRIGNFVTFSALHLAPHRLRCSAGIFNKCAPFPLGRSEKKDQWFLVLPTTVREQPVNAINVTREGRKANSFKVQYGVANFPDSLSDDDFETFYHGTSHESAENIISGGIDVDMGGKKKDFSNGGGFYVCKDFNEASSTRWAKNRPPCSAVLIFRVARAEFRLKLHGLDLRKDTEKWRNVVSYFRSGEYKPKLEKKLMLNEYDFIEGPMAGEGQNFSRPDPNKGSYQLCFRNDDCAKLFYRSIHSAVFFEAERRR